MFFSKCQSTVVILCASGLLLSVVSIQGLLIPNSAKVDVCPPWTTLNMTTSKCECIRPLLSGEIECHNNGQDLSVRACTCIGFNEDLHTVLVGIVFLHATWMYLNQIMCLLLTTIFIWTTM